MVGIKEEDGKFFYLSCYQFLAAKDRSGCLDMVEEPHLGKLLSKIKNKTLSTISTIKGV